MNFFGECKKHFFVKICFKSCIIKNRSQMYTSEKNTNELTVRGGGVNPYGQPDRKISVFFLTASLTELIKKYAFVHH